MAHERTREREGVIKAWPECLMWAGWIFRWMIDCRKRCAKHSTGECIEKKLITNNRSIQSGLGETTNRREKKRMENIFQTVNWTFIFLLSHCYGGWDSRCRSDEIRFYAQKNILLARWVCTFFFHLLDFVGNSHSFFLRSHREMLPLSQRLWPIIIFHV